MNCEKCGNAMNDNDKFCPKCGAPAPKPKESDADIMELQAELIAIINNVGNNESNKTNDTAEQVTEALQGSGFAPETEDAPAEEAEVPAEAPENQPEGSSESEPEVSAEPEPEEAEEDQPKDESEPESTELSEEETGEEPEEKAEEESVEQPEEKAEEGSEEQTEEKPEEPAEEKPETKTEESAEEKAEESSEEKTEENSEENTEEKPEAKTDEPAKEKTEEKAEPEQEEPEEKTGFIKSAKQRIATLPARTKKIIIISASAAAALALVFVLVFAVIIPSASPKIDASKYLTIVFDSQSQYEGCLSGSVTLDREAFLSDYKDEITDELAVSGSVDRLFYEAKLSYSVDEEEEMSDAELNAAYFDDLKSDDTLTVKLEWAPEGREVINREEHDSGFKFDKKAVTKTIKVSDYIEKQGVEIKQPVALDILDYIKANDLIITVPDDGALNIGLDTFKTEAGGYTLSNGGLDGGSVEIFGKDNVYLTSVYLEYSKHDDVSEGDVVTVDYSFDNYAAKQCGFLLAGDPVEYTVVASEELSAESALKNAEAVKTYFTKNIYEYDTDAEKGDKLEITAVYFSAFKPDASFDQLIYVYENKTEKYFKTLELSERGFFYNGRLIFNGYASVNSKEETAEDAVKTSAGLNGSEKEYTVTKVG